MKLYKKPGSPYWWHDFYFEGKRYRASTKEKTKAAAGTVAAAALTRLTEGSTITKRSHRAPILREFSKRFLAWAENSNTLKPNTRRTTPTAGACCPSRYLPRCPSTRSRRKRL